MTEYCIERIQDEDFGSVMDLLRRTFYVDEPLNQAVHLNETGICPELEDYCLHSLQKGVSFKAVDKNERKIVGALVCGVVPIDKDSAQTLITMAENCNNLKFRKILYILSRREDGSRLWEKYPEEKTFFDVKIAATDPAWRKKGIMNNLMKAAESYVKEKDIKILRMDTSSAYSAMVADKMGFQCIYSAKYKEILLNGEPLIVPDPPHVDDRVNIKIMHK